VDNILVHICIELNFICRPSIGYIFLKISALGQGVLRLTVTELFLCHMCSLLFVLDGHFYFPFSVIPFVLIQVYVR